MRLLAIGTVLLTASTGMACAEGRLTFYPVVGRSAPFSTATQVDDVLYLSGQIGLGADGKLASAFDDQARQTMANVEATLKAHGATFDDVYKCTVFLADMGNFAAFNKVYVASFKPDRLPARSAVGVASLAGGAALELECMAFVPRDGRRDR